MDQLKTQNTHQYQIVPKMVSVLLGSSYHVCISLSYLIYAQVTIFLISLILFHYLMLWKGGETSWLRAEPHSWLSGCVGRNSIPRLHHPLITVQSLGSTPVQDVGYFVLITVWGSVLSMVHFTVHTVLALTQCKYTKSPCELQLWLLMSCLEDNFQDTQFI